MHSADGTRVAITGIGYVTPIGHDAETVWSNLVEGVSGVGPVTHFDAWRHATRIAAEVKSFDPEDFMDGKTARNNSRYIHFGVAAAIKALADAQLDVSEMNPYDVGVIVSSIYGGNIDAHGQATILHESGTRRISPHTVGMTTTGMAAAVIAMKVRAGGLNYGISSACASGGQAIGEAAEIIRRGDAKVMIAGGSEACISPLMLAVFNRIRALSVRNDEPERACRPWDVNRDGFVCGEGAVVMILEDWDHARSRGARIHAEMAGYGGSTDMSHFATPDPAGAGAAQSMRMAITKAGILPQDVDYINAHGTATRLGDVAETRAIKRVFNGHANKVAVSSTKSVHAHMLGASGAMEAAVCVLAIERGSVPPTMNLEDQDPECDLDYTPINPRPLDIRIAISNSFGLGGHNTTLVLRKVHENGSVDSRI